MYFSITVMKWSDIRALYLLHTYYFLAETSVRSNTFANVITKDVSKSPNHIGIFQSTKILCKDQFFVRSFRTYPTLVKGKSSSKVPAGRGYVIVPRRVKENYEMELEYVQYILLYVTIPSIIPLFWGLPKPCNNG